MQFGFYFDQSRCTGCYACTIACRDWHDKQDIAVKWRRIIPVERGKYPDVYLSYVSLSCNHCRRPACADACPAGAISKRVGDGIIRVDRDQCLGSNECEMFCKQACPYDVPQFGSSKNSKMQLCTLCVDRLEENKNPICVDACPMRALDAGPMEELMKKYGKAKEAEGFVHSEKTNPSIIFKPRIYSTNPINPAGPHQSIC